MVGDGGGDLDVVVYEGYALVVAASAEAGDAACALADGANYFDRSRGGDGDFFLLEGDEFGVDCEVEVWLGDFEAGAEGDTYGLILEEATMD